MNPQSNDPAWENGNDFFAHKTGFTPKSLTAVLRFAGFPLVFTVAGNLEVTAVAFLNPPSEYARSLFGLAASA